MDFMAGSWHIDDLYAVKREPVDLFQLSSRFHHKAASFHLEAHNSTTRLSVSKILTVRVNASAGERYHRGRSPRFGALY
jgi:hypothetical protein